VRLTDKCIPVEGSIYDELRLARPKFRGSRS
jgi:hypothetical protein